MTFLTSVLGLACFAGAAVSFYRYNGQHFDLLAISGVILFGASAVMEAVYRAVQLIPDALTNTSVTLMSADIIRLLENANERLVNIQIAIENLEERKLPPARKPGYME